MNDTYAVRFFAYHGALGMTIGCFATALVYHFNVAGLGELIAGSDDKYLYLAAMAMFIGPSLGALQIAFALHSADRDKTD